MPASGSIQSQPKARASTRPRITITETAASAMTWMNAARKLLSRAAAPCACWCSSKSDGVGLAVDRHMGRECVRLGDFVDQLEIAAALDEGERLPRSVGPHRLDRDGRRGGRRSGFGAEPETRRNPVLEHVEDDCAAPGLNPFRLVVIVRMAVGMAMSGADDDARRRRGARRSRY